MINYNDQSTDFESLVYTLEGGVIECHEYGELVSQYAEQCNTPRGIRNRFFLEGNTMYSWLPRSSVREVVEAFDTAEEAEHALLLSFEYDMQHVAAEAPQVFTTRKEAEARLIEWLDEQDDA